MRLLAWVLTHCAGTVALSGLARQIRAELVLRADRAASGKPSPHQLLQR